MAEQITVARPYAEAAFALAREQNALPVWAEMLRVANNVANDERVRAALDNPRLSAAAKESLFLSLCGGDLNSDGKGFVRVLVEADRLGLLPQIRSLFDALKDQAEGIARAQITSAFPIDERALDGLKTALERRFGKKIEATVSVDPQLIGGARISVGDTVIDGSVQGELQALANHLRT
jgi:F-type H+-transporting ATPase subunit delta